MRDYIALWVPWMTTGEATGYINEALTNPQRWKADQLAWRLRLTAADRSALNITTIGAIDYYDGEAVGGALGIARAMACEVEYMNDEGAIDNETPQQRFHRMRRWIASQIKKQAK